jgi:hypothetical protein
VPDLCRRRLGDDTKPNLHFVYDLERPEQRAEGREAEIGLFERELARDDDLIVMLFVVHRYDN